MRRTRLATLATFALLAFATPLSAQGRHPLVGNWAVALPDGREATLVVSQERGQLAAELALPARRDIGTQVRLRGELVGDTALFAFEVPDAKDARPRQVRWVLAAHGNQLAGTVVQADPVSSRLSEAAPLAGRRIGR